MANKKQFGELRFLQFGRRTTCESLGQQTGDAGACAECEALLTDAVDGVLTAEEQARFDGHVATCEVCGDQLAEARRGAAWLEILRMPAPEPPAELLLRILAETDDMQAAWAEAPQVPQAAKSNVVPLHKRLAALLRESPLGQIALQPRLAMTAAMAFFSIALTLNLTGVRLQDLRVSELQAGSLQRDFFQTKARAAQYVTGLRMVHEMESRVRDLQGDDELEAPGQFMNVPFVPDHLQTKPAQPSEQRQRIHTDAQPEDRPNDQPKAKQPDPDSGTSQRESIGQRRLLVAGGPEHRIDNSTYERQEGARA